MNTFSRIGFAQNLPLTSSVRDEWIDSLAVASSLGDDAMKYTHSKGTQKFRRSPHKLRLDKERVVVSFCDLHSIPEDKPLCQYRQVLLERKAMQNEAKGEGEASNLVELKVTLFQN
jgi:hypothetical protein